MIHTINNPTMTIDSTEKVMTITSSISLWKQKLHGIEPFVSSCEGKIAGLWCDVAIDGEGKIAGLWCDVAIDGEGEIAGLMVLVAMLCVGCDGGLMVMLYDIGSWLVCLGKGVVLYLTAAWFLGCVVLSTSAPRSAHLSMLVFSILSLSHAGKPLYAGEIKRK